MKTRAFCDALKPAGMDQPTLDFLVKNPNQLEILVVTAKLARLQWFINRIKTISPRFAVSDKVVAKSAKKYSGSIQVDQIPALAAKLVGKKVAITNSALAGELGTSQSNLCQISNKYPYVAELLQEARAYGAKVSLPA